MSATTVSAESQSAVLEEGKPEFVAYRLQKFEEFKQRRLQELGEKKGQPITITLPDGSKKEGKAYETTPFDVAMMISKGLANAAICARVDDKLWDLGRPLEGDCKLELLKYDAKEAQEVFWHSSSHVLGEALERLYQCLLCKGPPLEHDGFYYEVYMGEKRVLENHYPLIEKAVEKVIAEKQPFERLSITKEEALELFKYSKFKTEILSEKVAEGSMCTVYRCGDLIDPCKGPHLHHTGRVAAFKVRMNSSSYWRADSSKEVLQRIYAISFPDKKLLKEWEYIQEEAKKRDHRVIGKEQELWFFHPYSPGSTFFLPHGQRIFNSLVELIKGEYKRRGYYEVQTPNLFSNELWKTSGHWDKYQENMFLLKVDESEFALKPMNCPGHCLMFAHRARSYRELPLRFADFGVLHRNELKGALTGMTRVRKFQQDDAHIFCREDQILDEIRGVLDFLNSVYGLFGFKFEVHLSTRPEKFLGSVETWDRAEAQLKTALDEFCKDWILNPGDGAFYGPKIDIKIEDAIKRKFQCGTVQLDFQLPQRFDLNYQNDASAGATERQSRPVIIHRAILGSVERFLAILTEHVGGKWPFWVSPRQVIVLPISAKFNEYAQKVRDYLSLAGYWVDVDASDNKINKKVRTAQLERYNFMLVVGEKEASSNSVNIRIRDSEKPQGEKSLQEFKEYLDQLKKEYK